MSIPKKEKKRSTVFFTSQICTSDRSSPSKTWSPVKNPTITRNAWMDGLKTRILSDFLRFRIQITRNAAKICKQLDLGISKTNKGHAFFSTALSYCQYTTGLAFRHDTLRRDGTSHKLHLTRCPRLWQGQTTNQGYRLLEHIRSHQEHSPRWEYIW